MNLSSARGPAPRRLSTLVAALAAAGLALPATGVLASSHREAPDIVKRPKVDATDVYAFRSYEAGRGDTVTVLANYQPFQDPQGGPEFYMFDEDALYEIHIDNNGDAKDDLSFQFRFRNSSKRQALPVGDQRTPIPLIISGPLPGTVNPDTLNVRETYSIDLQRGGNGQRNPIKPPGGADAFDKPVDNIGDKTFAGPQAYEAYARKHIYEIDIPGCEGKGKGRVFVGQRKEPFFIAVGKIFDLFNLDPLGPEVGGNNNDLEAKNVSSIALELPIACVARADEPVIGVHTTASIRNASPRAHRDDHDKGGKEEANGGWLQVSRLGMPLVNEAVIGRDDKDRFNGSTPGDDAQFAQYVTHPTLPALLQTLFPSAKAPTKFPRTDLVAAFLTGLAGLNQPKGVKPAELMRLNTSTPVTPAAAQKPLGVAAGDPAGFPNGRRPGDDIVDAELRVSMGALCVLTGANDALKVGCKPSDAPSGGLAFTDGVRKSAANYFERFPYLTTPISGNFNPPPAPGTTFP